MKEYKTKTSANILIVLYILIIYSGVNLLFLRFGSIPSIIGLDIWEWGLFHRIIAIAILIFTIAHIYRHYKWYKGLKMNNYKKRSRITLLLSVSFFLVILSTLILAFNIHSVSLEMIHSLIGLLFFLFATIHTLKRYKIKK